MGIPEKIIKELHELCNAHAKEFMESSLDSIEAHLPGEEWSRIDARAAVGKILATAYMRGWADCWEGSKVKKLYL